MKKSVKFIICCLGLSVALIASGLLSMWNTDAPKKPKYVFYFIGDGMSFNHILGTEQYNVVKEGKSATSLILPVLFSRKTDNCLIVIISLRIMSFEL